MKFQLCATLVVLGVLVSGCRSGNKDDGVVSKRYIHKYGYAVSKEDWENKNFPGQVITHMANGVTITSTHENGLKHGPLTKTFPHSQTVECYQLYNQDKKIKEINYDITGMPVQESVQLSPSRYSVTLWYKDGSPLSIEEYTNDELLEGQYFTASNEVESRVEKGNGLRIRRDDKGLLLSKEVISTGFLTRKETFFPNGSPESVVNYCKGNLHGEKRIFNQNGEPIAIEEWGQGKLHGLATYFKNGTKYLEVFYLFGQKNGIETSYVDGQMVEKEIHWENDKKHGPATFYVDGIAKTQWYYDGKQVSKERFEENNNLDKMASKVAPQLRLSN